ncbi:MAG: aspartate--tRNA ligase [Gemmatimonadaceae bacterium]
MTESAHFATALRSDLAGALRLSDVGRTVRLGGWVHRTRNLGGLLFLDLRDRGGLVQISFDPRYVDASTLAVAADVGVESVVAIEGEVVARPAGGVNPEMASGEIEVRGLAIKVLGPAATPALPVARGKGEKLPAEELRLRHRYLDLRRPELQANLLLRHRLLQAARGFLAGREFIEVETPILTKPTPEGARDYLVPSRVHGGEFYALPQSPQLYKQLLMISGFDRYFQIARCFRDEDLRADRQPEFSQIDIEASFVGPEDIFALTEALLGALWRVAGVEIPERFPRMIYAEAMERFGSDRPDLRYDLAIGDVSAAFADADFGITRSALAAGGRVRGIRLPGGAALSRKQVDELEVLAKGAGVGGLLRVKRVDGKLEGPIARFLDAAGGELLGLADGELGLYVAAPDHVANPALDRVRQAAAQLLGLVDADRREFLWVTDFPMFDRDPVTGALSAVHHPFTAPRGEDAAGLERDPAAARALAYDVVLNGTELGGGSIRIHEPQLQQRVFQLLGIDEATARSRFGFLLEALRAGAPPHGGIALGFDRIAMVLAGASSLREVIAFPKTTAARALFEGAPSPVPASDLGDLHLALLGATNG